MPLPEWITQDDERAHRFYIDADLAYERVMPVVREALEIAAEAPLDHYQLEVAHNFIKMDFDIALAAADLDRDPDKCIERIIRGSDGYKERWGWRHHRPGRHSQLRDGTDAGEQKYAKAVRREAVDLYRKVRRVVPR